jgi:hypothetical protein
MMDSCRRSATCRTGSRKQHRHDVAFRALLVTGALVISTAVLSGSVAGATPLLVASAPGPRSNSDQGVDLGHASPYLSRFTTVTTVASTVPGNGDLNPYGIVTVPHTTGALVRGDTLVSNFNAASNLQGTGTTIVQISPNGQQSLFAQITGPLPGKCPGGVGLTTALTVLNGGFVVVGSLPVTDAGSGTPEAGCLIVLNSVGDPIETWSGQNINGPWDLTAVQFPRYAELFVTNVLNGTVAAGGAEVSQGTVVRLDVVDLPGSNPRLVDSRVIGSGFGEQLNTSALVLGPTGLSIGRDGTLYVADTVNNRLAVIPFAWRRKSPVTHGGPTLTSGGSLNSPLGMALAPNGDVITVNGGDGNAVETTPSGQQVATVQIDPAGAGGDLFGLTIAPDGGGVLFVDDGDNTLKLFH